MTRSLLLLHRYLGIGLGLIMVMWCLSGVVMMYVSYPAMAQAARIKALPPISWEGCCRLPEILLSDPRPPPTTEIEMLAGRPVLYLEHQSRPFDLLTGSEIRAISAAQAAQVARKFSSTAEPDADPLLL